MDEFSDVESQLEPEPSPEPGPGIPWAGLTILIGLALVVVFAVQNTEAATVDFLWFNGEFPLSLVILVTALVSVLFTSTAGALYRRRRRKRRAEKQQLRELRGES